MREQEYRVQLQSILNLATLVHGLKIADVLQAINHAEVIGPILDPTTYLKSATSLECQKRIAEAALQFQQAIEKIAADPKYHTGDKTQ